MAYVQSDEDVSGTTVTSREPTLAVAATAGNILVAAAFLDKSAGAFDTEAGDWTVASSYIGTSTSLRIIYKTAAGGETSVIMSWTDARAASAVIAEYSGDTVTGALTNNANSGESTVTSIATGNVSAGSAGDAIAVVSIDTLAAQPSWSDSFVIRHQNPNTWNPGFSFADLAVGGASTVGPTASWSGADQAAAAVLFLPVAGGAVAATAPMTPMRGVW